MHPVILLFETKWTAVILLSQWSFPGFLLFFVLIVLIISLLDPQKLSFEGQQFVAEMIGMTHKIKIIINSLGIGQY